MERLKIMKAWLLSLLTILGSGVVTTTVSLVVSRVINNQFKKKDRMQEELEERKSEERKTEINSVLKEELEPLKKTITDLSDTINRIGDGTLSSLRNDILTCYYRCVEKGYRNDYDTINMADMFEAYDGLHGNSFISDIMERFKLLPTKEEYRLEKAVTKKRTKQGE